MALNTLHDFHNLNAPFATSAWHRLAQRMGMAHGPVESEQFDIDLPQLFLESATQLRRMARAAGLLNNTNATEAAEWRDALRPLIDELSNQVDVCGPGVISNVADTHTRLMALLDPPNLSTLLQDMRLQLARQLILQFVQRHQYRAANFEFNEIHMVAALQNHLADRYQLPSIEDRYASSDYVRDVQAHLPQLTVALNRCLSAAGLACRTAEHMLHHIAAGQAAGQPISYPQLVVSLNALDGAWGPLHPTQVCVFDQDHQPTSLVTHPLQLSLHLLERIQTLAGNHQPHWPPPLKLTYWAGHGADTTHLIHNDALVWKAKTIVIDQQPEPIVWDDLFEPALLRILNANQTEGMGLQLIHEAILAKADNNLPTHDRQTFLQLTPMEQRASLWCTLGQMGEVLEAIQPVINALERGLTPRSLASWVMHPAASQLGMSALSHALRKPGVLDESFDFFESQHGEPSTKVLCLGLALLNEGTMELGRCRISPVLYRAVLDHILPASSLLQSSLHKAMVQADTEYLTNLQSAYPSAEFFAAALLSRLHEFPNASTPVVRLLVNQLVNEPANHVGEQSRLEPETLAKYLESIAGTELGDSDTQTLLNTILATAPVGSITEAMKKPTLYKLIHCGKPQAIRTLLPGPTMEWTAEDTAQAWQELRHWVGDDSVQYQSTSLSLATTLLNLGLPIEGMTAEIMQATSINGSAALMRLWLESGASPSITTNNGDTLLHNAIYNQQAEMVSVLLQFGAALTANNNRQTALQVALRWGLVSQAVRFYSHQGGLNALDDDGYAPLHRAILEIPIPPASVGAEGALHTPEYQYAKTRIQALIEAGADVNQRCGFNHVGKTALHLAHRIAHRSIRYSVVSLLIEHGAISSTLDYKGRRPGMAGRRQAT